MRRTTASILRFIRWIGVTLGVQSPVVHLKRNRPDIRVSHDTGTWCGEPIIHDDYATWDSRAVTCLDCQIVYIES